MSIKIPRFTINTSMFEVVSRGKMLANSQELTAEGRGALIEQNRGREFFRFVVERGCAKRIRRAFHRVSTGTNGVSLLFNARLRGSVCSRKRQGTLG